MDKQGGSGTQQVVHNRRSWLVWIAWSVWLFFEIFFMQNAVASGKENEPRAATLFWIIFSILLLGGVITFVIRRINQLNQLSGQDD